MSASGEINGVTSTGEPVAAQPLVSMVGICKSFPGTCALKGVSLDLQAGEIHALVGENGAGKSTLIKILAGVYPYPHYEGQIFLSGQLRRFRNIHDAEKAGVAIVHQELSLIPELSIAENIFLGRMLQSLGVVRWDEMHERSRALLNRVRLQTDPRTPVRQLGIAQQQLIEIAKALSQSARVLVLDEPTSALTELEADNLFDILRELASHGVGIIYISHRLPEVFRLSRRITVLRDGASILTECTNRLDQPLLIKAMAGHEVNQLFPDSQRVPGRTVFEVQDISLENPNVRGQFLLKSISFSVKSGEVLGIAGLMGAGRTELLMALFGAYGNKPSGRILLDGARVVIETPGDAIAQGIAFVTEDRRGFGLHLDHSIANNLTLAALPGMFGGFLTNEPGEMARAAELMRELQIKAWSPTALCGTLSGGNQQKVVLGKWLLTQPRVIFLDEPTRGIDVGSREELYRRIDHLAHQGMAVVLVSSELEEITGLADRILVLHQGQIVKEFSRDVANAEKIMACAVGQPDLA
jgi:D-xylose transport system ATP-binding protein